MCAHPRTHAYLYVVKVVVPSAHPLDGDPQPMVPLARLDHLLHLVGLVLRPHLPLLGDVQRALPQLHREEEVLLHTEPTTLHDVEGDYLLVVVAVVEVRLLLLFEEEGGGVKGGLCRH